MLNFEPFFGPSIGPDVIYNVWFRLNQNGCIVMYYMYISSALVEQKKKRRTMVFIFSFYVKMRQNIDKVLL